MKHLRRYIRQMLIEAAGTSGAPYFSPPQLFKDETGIDLVHRYKLPPGFNSGKALQDWIDANEPEDPTPVDINDFYGPIVDELIKLNPELVSLHDVGKVEEWQLLPDQEMSDVYPWHLKDIVVGVASEFPLADLLYYFDGSSDTSWDIGTQIEKEIGVRPQWMVSPETAEKHFDLREHRIREHIRYLLLEKASAFQCWGHSAGFIKPDGEMIILPIDDEYPYETPTPISHKKWLDQNELEWNDIQDWVSVSNKSELEMMNFSPELNDQQWLAFIEFVIDCVPSSKSYDPERHIVSLRDRGGSLAWQKTMPEILHDFSNRELEERYWNVAMEKLQ